MFKVYDSASRLFCERFECGQLSCDLLDTFLQTYRNLVVVSEKRFREILALGVGVLWHCEVSPSVTWIVVVEHQIYSRHRVTLALWPRLANDDLVDETGFSFGKCEHDNKIWQNEASDVSWQLGP